MKINGVDVLGNRFAFDGCHKIYIIEDDNDYNEAVSYGYNIHNINELEHIYRHGTCDLVFISNWKLTKRYVEQFEKNVVFTYLGVK